MSYDKYLKDQITRAESKWGRKHDYDEIFKQALRLTVKDVEEFIEPTSICCMGCRSGTEVFEFKEMFPEAEVYGIDITERIETIRTHLDVKIELHDFNKLPGEWENKFDLVFSNSIDHAYDPAVTLKEWHRVCKGHLLIQFSTHPPTNIEHSFNRAKINKLMPKTMFKKLAMWDSPEPQLITALYEVVK